MGTEEKELEPAPQQLPKEQGSPEQENESPGEPPASDSMDPLKTYKWHTGSRGALNEVKEEIEAASSTSTINKTPKASTNKWSKMQNWRKALSEDPGDKNASSGKGGEGAKVDKGSGGTRKNPFRRALSEPPGSLFAALSPSSNSTQTSQTPDAAEASGVSSTDPSQRGGGGMLFKKYLRTVSQKLKRPRLQGRNSASNLLPGNVFLFTYSYCTM